LLLPPASVRFTLKRTYRPCRESFLTAYASRPSPYLQRYSHRDQQHDRE